MQLVLAFTLIIGLVWGQQLANNDPQVMKDGFPIPAITTTTVASVDKCGEGKTKGKRICVNHEYCDAVTNTIVDKPTAGVDNKGFRDTRCDDPLQVCCHIPDFTPIPASKISSTTKPANISNRCGRTIDSRKIGNNSNKAENGEFPWMVAIMKKNFSSIYEQSFSICGGSLISPSVVMTAAHCIDEYKADDLKIRTQEWDSTIYTERLPYQERNVAKIVIHEDFVRADLSNDVALLVLDTPLRSRHINTVCLPGQGEVIDSRNCFVSRWGKTVFGIKGSSQILNKVEAAILPVEHCQGLLRILGVWDNSGPNFTIHDSFLCTSEGPVKGSCMSFGGSPLVCPDPNEPFRYLLTGVVAWEIGCRKPIIPGVYADVAKFRSWVDDKMRRENLTTDSYIY